MPHHLPYSLVSRCLGILLLAAAGLKLNGLAVDPVGRMGLFTAPAFQFGVVELELFLAIWLLWGRQPLGSWTLALSVFTVFAGVSVYQGWIGRASCGCFGKLSVSPWYASALDLAVVLALLLGRPNLDSVWRQPRLMLTSAVPAISGMAGMVVLLAGFLGLTSWLYGSPDAALARWRGERISLYPRMVDVGIGVPGESREARFEVVNRTDHPIRVIGGAKD